MVRVLSLCMVGLILLAGPVLGQDALQQEAVRQAKFAFEGLWIWHEPSESWYLAYEIPLNPYTPILGQTEPVRRYIRAKDVGFSVNVRKLTPADTLNGLEWAGTVTFSAERFREYDVARGWLSWMNRRALEGFSLEKRFGGWNIVEDMLNVAQNGKVRQPTLSELPGEFEGPRSAPPPSAPPAVQCQPWEKPTPDGRCIPWRAPYGGGASQIPSPGSAPRPPGCRLTCSANDKFCSAVVDHLIEQNLCHEGARTSGYYGRMSDVGYYYCQQKQQRGRGVNPDAIQRQWTESFRPNSSDQEKQLDRYAVRTAERILCP